MRKRSTSRFANGIISALIVCFFIVHGLMGSLSSLFSLSSAAAWIVWIGMVFVAAHVVVSIVTSYQQMTDAEFPPSPRKKRHLVLKWTTGGLLLVMAGAHIACMRMFGAAAAQSSITAAIVTVALAAVLATHVCVGAKSLLTDLELSKGFMKPLRVVVIVLVVVISCATLIALAGI